MNVFNSYCKLICSVLSNNFLLSFGMLLCMACSCVLLICCVLLTPTTANGATQLKLLNWTLTGTNEDGGPLRIQATIPGDVFSDLHTAGIIADPRLGDNDVKLQWISMHNWTYTTTFMLGDNDSRQLALVQLGLDTVAQTFVNGEVVSKSSNMWHEHVIDINSHLRPGENNVSIEFTSPVVYARQQQQQHLHRYGYTVPPDGPPTIQHGYNHVNFIRKTQSSFGWDWGPAFGTMGVWRDIYLKMLDPCALHRVSAVPVLDAKSSIWMVHIRVFLYCSTSISNGTSANMQITIPALGVVETQQSGIHSHMNEIKSRFTVQDDKVKRWYPRGYGAQRLYNLHVNFSHSGANSAINAIATRFAFRTVDLVQEPVGADAKGLSYYFRVNGVPIFLKGTNWIPASPFLSAPNVSDNVRFLFDSMLSANMNVLRLWGGGVFESDLFYELADEMGLMIWHDFMFAVALYPADHEFLRSVRQEVTQQLSRIQSHPSIIVWAGNNENELGLVSGWFSSMDHMANHSQYRRDYMRLYNDTLWDVVNRTDYGSRPFVLASPSNGVDTIRHGGIAPQPGSTLFGDVHVYNYYGNAWRPSTYPRPRCATEYGLQSLPTHDTLKRALPADEDWAYFGDALLHRQHHPCGNIEMLGQAFLHFKIPSPVGDLPETESHCRQSFSGDNDTSNRPMGKLPFIDTMIFLSQAHQAIGYRTETEHYRRWRNRLQDSEGHCMCAMYWQLNDVWAAPTWSTVDVGRQWKMAHYHAREFFAPLLLSVYVSDDNEQLRVAIVSDAANVQHVDATLSIDVIAWQDTPFKQVAHSSTHIKRIDAFASDDVYSMSMSDLPKPYHRDNVVFRVQLTDVKSRAQLATESTLLPDKLYRVDTNLLGRVAAQKVVASESSDADFVVYLKASNVAPFVWLQTPHLFGNFSINAFTMTNAQHKLTYTCWQRPHLNKNCTLEFFKSDLTVVSTLADLYL